MSGVENHKGSSPWHVGLWFITGLLMLVRIIGLFLAEAKPDAIFFSILEAAFWIFSGALLFALLYDYSYVIRQYKLLWTKAELMRLTHNRQAAELQRLKIAVRDYMEFERGSTPDEGRAYYRRLKWERRMSAGCVDENEIDPVAGIL